MSSDLARQMNRSSFRYPSKLPHPCTPFPGMESLRYVSYLPIWGAEGLGIIVLTWSYMPNATPKQQPVDTIPPNKPPKPPNLTARPHRDAKPRRLAGLVSLDIDGQSELLEVAPWHSLGPYKGSESMKDSCDGA